jgi:hypothetical protein
VTTPALATTVAAAYAATGHHWLMILTAALGALLIAQLHQDTRS